MADEGAHLADRRKSRSPSRTAGKSPFSNETDRRAKNVNIKLWTGEDTPRSSRNGESSLGAWTTESQPSQSILPKTLSRSKVMKGQTAQTAVNHVNLADSSLEAVGLAGEREIMRSRVGSQRRKRSVSRSLKTSQHKLDTSLNRSLDKSAARPGESPDLPWRVRGKDRSSASAAVAAAGMAVLSSGSISGMGDAGRHDDGLWREETPRYKSLEIRDTSSVDPSRLPGDPTDEVSLQVDGVRLAMLSLGRVSVWALENAMEMDSRDRGLILAISPGDVHAGPMTSKTMSSGLRSKLKLGWEAFLNNIVGPGHLEDPFGWGEIGEQPPLAVFGMTVQEASELKETLQTAMGAPKALSITMGDLVPHLGKLINVHLAELVPSASTSSGGPGAGRGGSGGKKSGVRFEEKDRKQAWFTSMHHSEGIVAVGLSDGRIVVIDSEAGKVVHTFTESEAPRNGGELPPQWGDANFNSPVGGLSISTGGGVLLSGSEDGSVKIWDLKEKACLWLNRGHAGPIQCMDASHYPLFATSARGEDLVPRVWNVAAFNEGAADRALFKFEGHSAPVTCLSMTHDGRKLATGAEDSTIHLWDCIRGGLITIFRHEQPVNCISMSGGLCATGSDDGSVRVWDLALLREHCCIRKHQMAVRAVHMEGTQLVSSSDDGTTAISSAEERGACRIVLSCDPLSGPGEVGAPCVCQAVGGNFLITKEAGQLPVARQFNSEIRDVGPSNKGPCGFGGGDSPEKSRLNLVGLADAASQTPGKRGDNVRSAVVVESKEVERRVGVADPDPGPRRNSIVDLGRRREVMHSAQTGPAGSKQDLPSIRFGSPTTGRLATASLVKNDLSLSYALAVASAQHQKAGRKERAAGASTSPIKRVQNVDMRSGFHWGSAQASSQQSSGYVSRLPPGPAGHHGADTSHTQTALVANAWHVTGERDRTITGLPSFTAWRHNWITSRASDRRVDNALMHAQALKEEIALLEDYTGSMAQSVGRGGGSYIAFARGKPL